MTTTTVEGNWTLLTSHGLVLFWLARHPDSTLNETASGLGLTERRIATIIKDLDNAGCLERRRLGRCNSYSVAQDVRFRHPVVSDLPFKVLLTAADEAQAGAGVPA